MLDNKPKHIQIFGCVSEGRKTELLQALGRVFSPYFEDKISRDYPELTFKSEYRFEGFPKETKGSLLGSQGKVIESAEKPKDVKHSFSFDFGKTFDLSHTGPNFAYLDGGKGHSEDDDLREIYLHEARTQIEEMVLLIEHMKSVGETASCHINEGRHVISSFSTASVFAYAYGCGYDKMVNFEKWFHERVKNLKPEPTFYVLLLAQPALASEKIQEEMKGNSHYRQSDYERFDTSFFERLNRGYFDFLKRYPRPRVIIQDAFKPVETVVGIIEEGIKKHLARR